MPAPGDALYAGTATVDALYTKSATPWVVDEWAAQWPRGWRRDGHRRQHGGGQAQGRKTLAERAAAPTLEVVVMMRRGARHEVEVVRDAAVAVDAILAGDKYKLELRQRDPATGALWVRLDKA